MTLKEDAEQEVRGGACDACSAVGCVDEDTCDGFQEEVKSTLQKWIAELEGATIDCVDCDQIRSCNFKHCKYKYAEDKQ